MLPPIICGNSFAPDKDLFHVVEPFNHSHAAVMGKGKGYSFQVCL